MHDDVRRVGRRSARLKELRRRVRTRRPGEVVVDGRRMVEDLVRWGVAIRELYVGGATAETLFRWEPRRRCDQLYLVDNDVLAGLAPTRHPQGVLAVVDEPAPGRWDPPEGIGIFLDGVQDPGNVGGIIRGAAALGAEAVILGRGCADPFHPAAVRGSAGSALRIPLVVDADPASWVARVRESGGSVWATGAGGTPVAGWAPERPVLLVLGSEGRGLGPSISALTDGTVTIPLDRDVESLNVAVAAGVLLYAVRER